MTVLPDTMATRNRILTTAKAPERALRQAESDQPATDPAPFFFLVRMNVPSVVRKLEETETTRSQIRTLLEEGLHTAKEISSAVHRSEKEVENHLEHLRKSLHSEGRQLEKVPAECRGCGFVFRKRERLKAPSRCPVCKGEAISDPSFRVAGGQDRDPIGLPPRR